MRPAVLQRRVTVGASADDEATENVNDEDGDMCTCHVRSATFLHSFLFFLLPFLFFFFLIERGEWSFEDGLQVFAKGQRGSMIWVD